MAFAFELVSPEALVLAGEAEQVVVPGVEGYFTVMANHSAMMSTIKPGIVDVKMADGTSKHIFVRGGFADVSPTGLTVLAEHAVALNDMDVAELETEIATARESISAADTTEKREKAASLVAELEDSLAAIKYTKSSTH